MQGTLTKTAVENHSLEKILPISYGVNLGRMPYSHYE